jgi:hypothetical protein
VLILGAVGLLIETSQMDVLWEMSDPESASRKEGLGRLGVGLGSLP